MVLSASEYLDDETILSKLPFISVDEISNILAKKDLQDDSKFEENTNLEDTNLEEEDDTILEE